MKGISSLLPGVLRLVVILLTGVGFLAPLSLNASNNTLPEVDFTCPGTINVTLKDDCQILVDVKNVLLGDHTGVDFNLYSLVIKDDVPENGPVVDGCGTYEYSVTGPDNFSCWGYITAEDKSPLEIVCPDPISGYYEYNTFRPFYCTDLDTILIVGEMTYTTDAYGTVVDIPEALKKILDITGYPTIYENCGDVVITVKDEVMNPKDPCDDIMITRTFSATNTSCGDYSDLCTQKISIGRPGLDDVILPKETVELNCSDDIKLDAYGNPHPDETGYPRVKSAFARHKINDVYCNLGASYKDAERVVTCEGTYKVIRTWQVIDWCAKENNIYEFTQIIKVGDTTGPEVLCQSVDYDNDGYGDIKTFSTGPYDCTASFEVPMPVVEDDCSSWKVTTEILAGSYDGPVVATVLPGKSPYVSGIPVGCHIFRYTVIDDCGNKTVKYCPFLVEDQIAPIAVCNDDLHVSIGGEGYARVDATDIDEGSSDNCGPIRIEVRRRILDITTYECLDVFDVDGNGIVINDEVRPGKESGDPDGDGYPGDVFYYTPWEEYVEFTCCDMNENVRIELRVWDDRNRNGYAGDSAEVDKCFNYDEQYLVEDNFNVCWLDVLVEDKVPPTCTPPLIAEVDCDKLPYDFDPGNSEQMTALFGAAEGADNCPGWLVEELAPDTDNINDCGAGYFTRYFSVTDAKGIKSVTCEQTITIHQIHDYWIKFPADTQSDCSLPMPDTVMVEESACDLMAISVKDEFFSAAGDECYKIFRTYSVINWCEYDGESDPVVVSRDEDCDGIPGDEDVYVIVKTLKEEDPCYDYYGGEPSASYEHVWYDRDNDPFNQIPLAGTKKKDCDYETNPYGFWKELVPITENEPEDKDSDDYPWKYEGDHCQDMASVGYWQYTQVIKVYDSVDPIVTFEAPEAFCSFTNDCEAEVEVGFIVEENCSPDEVTVQVLWDEYNDGVVDADLSDQVSGEYPKYLVSGTFSLGLHAFKVLVDDGCGNKTEAIIPFEVIDCKAPTPICINGLAVELMPVIPAEDVDGDGVTDDGAVTIWASDFIASPSSDCNGVVTYSINRSEGGIADRDKTSLTLTCNDPPNTPIQIWAYDDAGNSDLCETYVLVQNNIVQCGLTGSGALSGVVAKENSEAVQDVEVNLSGMGLSGVMTDEQGRYSFNGLSEGFDYTLTAYKDDNPLNGISTFDLVVMSKHILSIQPLNSPYKLIAADVNNSGTVTTLDVISLRKVVLNIDTKFQNNTSWRFIPTDYSFPNPSNPWQSPFPEVLNINNLQGLLADRGFVAIKIGDLNMSAVGNALQAEQRSPSGTFALSVDEQQLRTGGTYQVDFRAEDIASIQGYQGTLVLDPAEVELVDILYGEAGSENFGLRLLEEGLITTSWNRNLESRQAQHEDDVLFSLVLRSRKDAKLSDVLSLNSRQIIAEAYGNDDQLLDLGLNFGSGTLLANFELYQNTPNPFRTETSIGFYLPEAGEVTLRIHDAGGRLLKQIRGDFAQGKHQLTVDRNELPASGILYYTLTNGDQTATRKMVLM
ncbi:MAG: T9SS type A sorting domain-containing protein [Saprospiraceae bacterium]